MDNQTIMVFGFLLMCCVICSNGKVALKTHKNELPKERRKIVKLLLRNFPLQESASYHNLVEDDEAGQPIHRGSSMTKYAPAYPYEEESMSELRIPSTKLNTPDISKFEYALSTILLPPPMSPETLDNSEDNADVYYAPYMQHMYSYDSSYVPDNSEDNADVYYAPYMQNDDGKQNYVSSDPEEEFADEYYIPYMKYDQPDGESYYLPYHQQQQQDQWLQYYHPQPLPVVSEEYQELPVHDAGSLYEGPAEEVPEFEDESLPDLGIGIQYTGPATNDNEIFDMPRVFLKLNQ